jgi:hypothetical protein
LLQIWAKIIFCYFHPGFQGFLQVTVLPNWHFKVPRREQIVPDSCPVLTISLRGLLTAGSTVARLVKRLKGENLMPALNTAPPPAWSISNAQLAHDIIISLKDIMSLFTNLRFYWGA